MDPFKPEPVTPSPTERPAPAGGLVGRLWEALFAEPLRRVDDEAHAFLASEASQRADAKVMIVLVTAAVALTLLNYGATSAGLRTVVRILEGLSLTQPASALATAMHDPETEQITYLTHWALMCVAAYFVLPALVIRLLLQERVRDYGVKLRGAGAAGWLYGIMLLVMVPLVYLMSGDDHFQRTYPFYRLEPGEGLGAAFWRWELLYALQFIALEFFFRGFLVHGTRHRFGRYAVFVMMVPYCMIHFQKPLPECLASIVAGIVLGFMSLKTRSIWLGAALHISVAWSMDFMALGRRGLLSLAG